MTVSNFSDIYDIIRSAIPTLLAPVTGEVHTEIPNPYSLEDNPASRLHLGWGIKIGTASPSIDGIDKLPNFPFTQDYEVVLTRGIRATANNADKMVSIVKGLEDDINAIAIDFTTTRFKIPDQITELNINSITSVENVTAGKFNHVTASIIFEITHWR